MNHVYRGIAEITVEGLATRVQYEYEYYNDGIGPYVFQGTPGFDKGHDRVRINSIIPIFTDETEDEAAEIRLLINSNFDKYAEQIKEDFTEV